METVAQVNRYLRERWILFFVAHLALIFFALPTEAPITAAATTFHPRDMIIALVNGGAHIDFRARDSHTALHRAAICGNYEAIQVSRPLQIPFCPFNTLALLGGGRSLGGGGG